MCKENIIKTRDFGEIIIKEEYIIKFVNGMYGFEDYKDYVLLMDEPEDEVMFLQSLNDMNLSFILIDPYVVFNDYNPILNEEELEELKVKGEAELKYLAIAIINENIKDSVVNLKSPIAINPKLKIAKQVILQNSYPLRCGIISSVEGKKC